MIDMKMRGRVWKFGDAIPNDGGILERDKVKMQIYDPDVLAKWCLEEINPVFTKEVKPNDILVAGKNFGEGHPHLQGFMALKGTGVGVITESMSRGALRCCINAGIPVIPFCPGITLNVDEGQEIFVDFENGVVENITTGIGFKFDPIPTELMEIIKLGGGLFFVKKQLSNIKKEELKND